MIVVMMVQEYFKNQIEAAVVRPAALLYILHTPTGEVTPKLVRENELHHIQCHRYLSTSKGIPQFVQTN